MNAKEKLEVMNLRNRIIAQREEIKRLQAEVEKLKKQIAEAAA